MREEMMPKIRSVRKQISKQMESVSNVEAEQVGVLDDYALGVQTALNLKGKVPFDYAGIEASDALDEIATSLDELEKRGSSREDSEEETGSSQANSGKTGEVAREI
jgi:MinD-like ATPase involved in chromosome partitioning or flagellar assembly